MIKSITRVKKGWLLGIFLMVTLPQVSVASHLRAGEITVERISCVGRTFRITITVFTNTASTVVFGGDGILDFGDGTTKLVPEIANTPREDLGENIGTASYSITHTYGGVGTYTISYVEPNRNGGVLNMDNSFFTTFYLETQIDLAVLGCGNSPRLLVAPIDKACAGVAFYHNPGAYDPDGDSLSYELVIPFRDKNLPVVNYISPEVLSTEKEDGTVPPTFSINPIDGTLIWDSPPAVNGEYNIAFTVSEWRKIGGEWSKIGFIRRDMQIIVDGECTNERPELDVPEDICVVAGTNITETIFGTDPENRDVKIEAFSEVFEFGTNRLPRATVSPDPPVEQPSSPAPAELVFNWQTECVHVKDQPYDIVFKITDSGNDDDPELITFETWRITVVAPPPVLQSPPVVNFGNRYATIEWDSYDCKDAASTMQIWRRVDNTSFTPMECQTGMPESLGFTLIDLIPIKDSNGVETTTYTDTNNGKGLAVGASYCYRLVAVFPAPFGGESYVSNEVCTPPINADAPVITHVTVDKTGDGDGEVTIRWTPPFDIDAIQFPPPYEYKVQRAQGAAFIDVSPQIVGTTFMDASLDTKDQQYFYRVLLFSSAFTNPVDTSEIASTVRLDLATERRRINLSWGASVPWSNQLQSFPLHDVFRGPEGATTLADLELIASVDVTVDGFEYSDVGLQNGGDSLDLNTVYCYAVLTRGGYGNPAIPEPLENYSQINCGTPITDEPPCKPVVSAFLSRCEDYFNTYACNSTNFRNVITWSASCDNDLRGYIVYSATTVNGTYVAEPGIQTDTFYIHEGLPSLARCYRIAAVDRSGNIGELSDPLCNENCPYYELPNVFSPNGDLCNEKFSAFGVNFDVTETPPDDSCNPPGTNDQRCARFVMRVDFKVFNRWGKKVYEYTGERGNENSIYINWDGRDSSGKELATAVYYYSADVTFDSTEPNGTVKTIKGWVHLVR